MKACGDGTYIIVPFILGLVSDSLQEFRGIECTLAGSGTLLGTLALPILLEEMVMSDANTLDDDLHVLSLTLTLHQFSK
jgi:hypothetical protein|tara:strand:+ start:163 stop:399 length:237 start_codon:yes stop_codon:yes gene_type:complete